MGASALFKAGNGGGASSASLVLDEPSDSSTSSEVALRDASRQRASGGYAAVYRIYSSN